MCVNSVTYVDEILYLKNKDDVERSVYQENGKHFIVLSISIFRDKEIDSESHKLDKNDFKLKNSTRIQDVIADSFVDYSWCTHELTPNSKYDCDISFLTSKSVNCDGADLYLEVDFKVGINAVNIYLKEEKH